MAVPKTTIWPLEPHTKTKHLILGEYLAAWLPIMSKWNRRIVFIDGFAGPGRYSGGEEGSPLIALRTALEHNRLSPDCEFSFLFIEADKKRADHLREEIEQLKTERPFLKQFSYEVANARFEEKINRVLIELTGAQLAPTLAFIDPFGFEGLPMRLVAEIAKYRSASPSSPSCTSRSTGSSSTPAQRSRSTSKRCSGPPRRETS